MSLYVCENCQCIENTALGQYWYWQADRKIYPEPYNGKNLCSECAAPNFIDGTETGLGKWHNRWPKITFEDYLKENPESELRNYKK